MGNPRVFGSIVHDNDTEVSDLDLLIDRTPDTTLLDISEIQRELDQLVDVLTPQALPEKFHATVLVEEVAA